jgi:hypothetical protein
VSNVQVKRNPPGIEGVLRNNTTHTLHALEVFFDLADSNGSGIGAVAVRIDKLDGDAITTFKIPIKQRNAVSALFREARSR